MRYLALLLLMTACKATPAELSAVHCDPTLDLEKCDDTWTRRMTCNPGNGQWTPFELCLAPQSCVSAGYNDAGFALTACGDPNAGEDATSGFDAIAPGDTAATDALATDGKSDAAAKADVKPKDVVAVDTVAADVPIVTTLPNQACFQKHCPTQTLMCLKTSTCIAAMGAAMDCMTMCGGGQGCVVQCQGNWSGDTAAFSLASCGMLICAGGCGDGLCEANETPTTCPGDCKAATTGSCAGLCGQKSTDCYCDQPCVGKGDCCNDYAAMCGG